MDERFMGVNAQYERDLERAEAIRIEQCNRGNHEAPPGGRECGWCGAPVPREGEA